MSLCVQMNVERSSRHIVGEKQPGMLMYLWDPFTLETKELNAVISLVT